MSWLGVLADVAQTAATSGGIVCGIYARRLLRRVHTDALTGLPNRTSLYRRARRRIGPRPAGLLLADLNRFKQVNDTYGHRIGDLVLCEVADQLRAICGPGEIPIRLHGDEFAVLLTRPGSLAAIEQRACAVRAALAGQRTIAGYRVDASLSVGYACTTETSVHNLVDLLSLADRRMYTDKTIQHARIPATALVA